MTRGRVHYKFEAAVRPKGLHSPGAVCATESLALVCPFRPLPPPPPQPQPVGIQSAVESPAAAAPGPPGLPAGSSWRDSSIRPQFRRVVHELMVQLRPEFGQRPPLMNPKTRQV